MNLLIFKFGLLNSQMCIQYSTLELLSNDFSRINTKAYQKIYSPFQVLLLLCMILLSPVQLLSRIRLFETPCTAACQASLSITNSWRLLKLMSVELVMPSNHLIPCHTLFLLPSILPSIRVISNESVLSIRWPKYWSFSISISPSSDYSGLNSMSRAHQEC